MICTELSTRYLTNNDTYRINTKHNLAILVDRHTTSILTQRRLRYKIVIGSDILIHRARYSTYAQRDTVATLNYTNRYHANPDRTRCRVNRIKRRRSVPATKERYRANANTDRQSYTFPVLISS